METRNVVDEHPEIVGLLNGLFASRVASTEPPPLQPRPLPDYSPEEIENLRSLGYIR